MNKKVAVIGLGYVGLPLASLCSIKGHNVIGLDTNEVTVRIVNSGQSHIRDSEVERLVKIAHSTGNFIATNHVEDISMCTHYLICVPTPVDKNHEPDLSPLYSAVDTIYPFLKKNDLVIIESTVFPGTCEQKIIPRLNSLTNMKDGVDYYIAHCPERINPGDEFWSSENIPRVVGSTSQKGVDEAAIFYNSILGGGILDVRDIKSKSSPKFSATEDGCLKISNVPLGSITKMRSIRDAEAVKAMENTVRDVNIAFVNELAKISNVLSLDVVDIIHGMATKPFGKGPFYPGIGVGGHCIAVDPQWLKAASKRAGYIPEIIELARVTNNGMPEYTVSLLQDELNNRGHPLKDTVIAILGVAYKRNVDDPRESPFFRVRSLLKTKGAILNVFDNWVKSENTVSSLDDAIRDAKAILIVTEHSDIINPLKKLDLADSNVEVIVDGRNCLDENIFLKQNISYRGIGRC